MFLGEYKHTIDVKGRLTIPAKYRGELATGLVVTRGFDQNLMLFPMDGWNELAERIKHIGIKRADLAKALSISPGHLSRYLRGKGNVSSRVIDDLVRLFAKDIEWEAPSRIHFNVRRRRINLQEGRDAWAWGAK